MCHSFGGSGNWFGNATLRNLLYGVDARPPLAKAGLAALAHLLAIVASIATAPLLIAGGLGLDQPTTLYVVASALVVSGAATLLQCVGVGPFGSRLLSIQGTSFAFIGAMILGGQMLTTQGAHEAERLGILLGSAATAALLTVLVGHQIRRVSAVLTPTVAGVTIVLLGLTLVQAAFSNGTFAWQQAAAAGAAGWEVPLQAVVVVLVILGLSASSNPWVRLSSIFVALVVGTLVAAMTTGVAAAQPAEFLSVPRILPFSLGFDVWVFLLMLPIFLVTIAESVGDLTATSSLSGFETGSPAYWRQVRGGVMADGVNTVLAALFGTFPNTTFSQNNGVIRMTGVASRFVGGLVAIMLLLFGLLPQVAAWFQTIPGGVLHSATGVLFAMIAWTGWQLLQSQPDPRAATRRLLVCGVIAFGASALPPLGAQVGVNLPPVVSLMLGFPVATGALAALLLEWRTLRTERTPLGEPRA